MNSVMITLISLCAFGTVWLLCLIVFRMKELKHESKEITKRLKFWLSEKSLQEQFFDTEKKETEEENFAKRVLMPIGEQVGKWMAEKVPYHKQSAIRKLLIASGYRDKKALQFFYAIKTGLSIGVAIFAWFIFTVIGGNLQAGLVYAVLGAVITFIFPNILLDKKVTERRQNIDRILPDALDLLVICTEAGMGIDLSLLRVAANLGTKGKELSEEIIVTNREMNLGQERALCWDNFGTRTGSEELKNLARIIFQSEKVGASISGVLRSQSEFLRVKRRQKAEETAAKVTVKMMIPMALFIFPCIMAVIMGPIVLQFMTAFKGGLQ